MTSMFWDHKDIILIEYLPQGETIKAVRYCKTLKKLRRAIQNKRRDLLTRGVCLLHDNARLLTANVMKQFSDSFGWDVLNRPLFVHFPEEAYRWKKIFYG
uniref:Mariner Mos1 transposase n=1 Tax=Schizaphis graminum TaxID=13262 RepID=A0A2S2P1P4_SCHGA